MLKELKRIRDMPLGVSKLSYRIENLDADVIFTYEEDDEENCHSGVLKFDFVISILIESENYIGSNLPPGPFILYELKQTKRDEFRAFTIWFEDGEVITVTCKSVSIGSEKF